MKAHPHTLEIGDGEVLYTQWGRDASATRRSDGWQVWALSVQSLTVWQGGHSRPHVRGRRSTMTSQMCFAAPHPYPGGGSPDGTALVLPALALPALSWPRRPRSGQRR